MAIYLKKVLSFIEMKTRAEDVDSQSFLMRFMRSFKNCYNFVEWRLKFKTSADNNFKIQFFNGTRS